MPRAASVSLTGHHAAVTALVLQISATTLLYSLSRDRVIKVWDVQGQVCLQVFNFLNGGCCRFEILNKFNFHHVIFCCRHI